MLAADLPQGRGFASVHLFRGPTEVRGGAHNRVRTDDLFLTKEVLCQLSYVGPRNDPELVVGREGIEPPQS